MYGYQGNHDTPEILERGTYTAEYDIPTGGTIILEWNNGLGIKNHVNVLLLLTFIMRESVWDVRDSALQNCPKDGDSNWHCLILPTLGEQLNIKFDLKLLNTQPILQINQPTAEDISNLPWYDMSSQSEWDPYYLFYDKSITTLSSYSTVGFAEQWFSNRK